MYSEEYDDEFSGIFANKRIVSVGPIDVHPTEKAIVIHFKVEAVVITELGDPLLADVKNMQKIIHLKGLNTNSNLTLITKEMIRKCSHLIDSSLAPEIELLLSYLKERKDSSTNLVGTTTPSIPKGINQSNDNLNSNIENIEPEICELDNYLEMLYENIPRKIKATSLILQLARQPDNLSELVSHEVIIGALARVLREDWKKSIELATNIVYVFFCFSAYTNFHYIVSNHKIGSLCLQIIEHEIKRSQHFKAELTDLSEKPKLATSVSSSNIKDEEKLKQTHQNVKRKQDQLLRVCFFLLLNLAENKTVEMKMRMKGLIQKLTAMLDRDNEELLILSVSFLKRLSVYAENKDEMCQLGILKSLSTLFPSKNHVFNQIVIRLLLNLSFDCSIQLEIIKQGYIPKFYQLVRNNDFKTTILCILIHISMNKESLIEFCTKQWISFLRHCISNTEEHVVLPEFVGLIVNLIHDAKFTQDFIDAPLLSLLINRSLKNEDSLQLKIVRTLSQQECFDKMLLLEHVAILAEYIISCKNEDMLVEAVAILSSIIILKFDYKKLLTDFNFTSFLLEKLTDIRDIEDDLLLEVIMLISTICRDESSATLLMDAGLLVATLSLLKEKQEDDEIVLQIVYIFYLLLFHPQSRKRVISDSQVPAYLAELMHDKNKKITHYCDHALDIIMEQDPGWARRIMQEKFKWHNLQWLKIVMGEQLIDDSDLLQQYGEDDLMENLVMPHYLLSTADVTNYDSYERNVMQTGIDDATNFDNLIMDRNALMLEQYGAVDDILGNNNNNGSHDENEHYDNFSSYVYQAPTHLYY